LQSIAKALSLRLTFHALQRQRHAQRDRDANSFDGVRKTPSKVVPRLLDLGIDKNLAKRAREAAAMPEKEFVRVLAKPPLKAAGRVAEVAWLTICLQSRSEIGGFNGGCR
jgi:type IV secretory pathway VirD2 relaxase